MKNLGVILFVFAILFAILPEAAAEESAKERAMVIFSDKTDPSLLEGTDIEVIEYFQNVPAAFVMASDDSLSALNEVEGIVSVEKDEVVKPAVQLAGWALPMIQSGLAADSPYTGKGVRIGIIDSGISSHPDLRISGGVSIVNYTESYHDDNGHGTHVAGIIGALDNTIGIKGVAPEADLFAIKVFSRDNTGSLIDVIRGIDWAITNKMDIINLSLGTDTGSQVFHDMIKRAHQKNIVIVAAAGNKGFLNPTGDTVEYPARYDEVIAVSAVDRNQLRGTFSAAGPSVDIAAPGVEIRSTFVNGGYKVMNGTSMAAPFVAGEAALIKQAYPGLTTSQIRNIILKNTIDLGAKGLDPIYGYGLIQSQPYMLPIYGKFASMNPPESLVLDNTEITGIERTTSSQKAKVRLAGGEVIDITNEAKWKSSNPEVAYVNKGKINLLAPGTSVITVSHAGFSATIDLTVEPGAETVAISFTDVPSDYWAYKEISEIAERKVIKGYPDFTFQPSAFVKRVHTAVMLDRVMELTEDKPYLPFTDVPQTHIYYEQIKAVQQAGIFDGNAKGFNPDGVLTRAQMAKVLVNAFDIDAAGTSPFPDAQAHWAKEFIDPLYMAGVTTGSQGKFEPERKVTRAEFAVFMHRALKWQEENR